MQRSSLSPLRLRSRIIRRAKKAKIVLVLDLDQTCIVTLDGNPGERDIDNIDFFHTLSEETFKATALEGRVSYSLKIINPTELSSIIEDALADDGEVIFLTSGVWDPTMRDLLAKQLNLSERAVEKLQQSRFHSSLTDIPYHAGLTWQEIKYLKKNVRLEKIKEHDPSLKDAEFIVLDDHPEHIASFEGVSYAIAIYATTDEPKKEFYGQVKKEISKKRSFEEMEDKYFLSKSMGKLLRQEESPKKEVTLGENNERGAKRIKA